MVLQRDKPLVIWGQADPGKEVNVSFAGDSATVTSSAKGDWKATLKPQSAQAKGSDLKISAGNDSKTLTDVLVGEVWFKSSEVKGSEIVITFDQAAGLKSRDGQPLKRFEIAGSDRVWHWADAKIDGETIIVSSPEVSAPKAVRYACCSNPEGANLVNGQGLPTSVFRTDDWKIK